MNQPDVTIWVYDIKDLMEVIDQYTREGLYEVEVYGSDPTVVQEWQMKIRKR
jgi:hypothetical protein